MAARSQMVSLRRESCGRSHHAWGLIQKKQWCRVAGELQIEVTFADVLHFVRERGAQRGVIPTDGFERQQDAVADGGGRAQIYRETDGETSG